MTVYYNAKESIFWSLVLTHSPALWVLLKAEFWFHLVVHIVLVSLTVEADTAWPDLDWRVAGTLQFFTTLFLTFYNDHCYSRYLELYHECMKVINGSLLFIHELCLTFKKAELKKHRLQAAKYILASVFMFFAGVACNGDVSPPSKDNLIWTEIVKKGLLTTNEKNVLSRYPGPEIMPVLVTWTMYVVDDALNKDSMWKKKSHRTAHVHDRFHRIVVDIQLAARNIGMWLAMPLPFSYWQFLNWVVFINFTLLSIVLAGFRTWWTLIPYIISLIVFVALREVSNALANPFGRDTVDFPLTRYLEYAFDHGVCLLLAFSHQGADADQYRRVQAQIKNATELEDMEARRRCDAGYLYKDDYRSHVDGFFSWNRTQPLQLLSQNGALDGKCLLTHIEEVLSGFVPLNLEDDEEMIEEREQTNEAIIQNLRKLQRDLKKLKQRSVDHKKKMEAMEKMEALHAANLRTQKPDMVKPVASRVHHPEPQEKAKPFLRQTESTVNFTDARREFRNAMEDLRVDDDSKG